MLLGHACGDALGVPYEFGPGLPGAFEPAMAGGRPFGVDPGEHSDDTAMAVCSALAGRVSRATRLGAQRAPLRLTRCRRPGVARTGDCPS
jgi:ADP-ribosylglycohydrolase